jgi:hypothetical protein
MVAPAIKVQTWAEDLRLPCFTSPGDIADLLTEADRLRRPSIPFQSKHLPAVKRNVWFALRRPMDRSRSGLLWVWPEKNCCVYIAGAQPQRVALLRLRVDPQFFSPGVGPTVFTATLSAKERKLRLEDVLMWKGRDLSDKETFTQRWQLARQWLEHYCIMDSRLLSGLDLELAPWQPLAAVHPDGVWEFQSDSPGRRLMWIARYADSANSSPALGPMPPPIVAPKMEELTGPVIAVATRAAGPEQWMLSSSDGMDLGRALVRTMAVSGAMRSVKAGSVRVEVEWCSAFQKWEICGLESSGAPASHSAVFDARKV